MGDVSRAATCKPIEQLWQDYLFLSNEMLKFIAQDDNDMFFALMEQRDNLQQQIDEAEDVAFRYSEAGRQIVKTVMQVNQQIVYKLQLNRNMAKRNDDVSSAYDGYAGQYVAGSRGDWRR